VPPIAEQRYRVERFWSAFSDARAFRAWYESALPHVFGYLYRRCGGDRALAEELTQETFVDVVRGRAEFDGRSNDATWLIGIARHKLVDHYRVLHRTERRRLALIQSRPSDVYEPVSAWETRRHVVETLARLPSMQRAALVLHYLDGLPVADVARLLGKSEAAVESLMTRGREQFRSVLAKEADDV
jgi:RNA polymerase sigma-70 factor (ECF subfamily)